MPRKVPISIRFWDKVAIKEPGECWPWQASLDGCGYGFFRLNGSMRRSHRVAWELSFGPIPSGVKVCHKCDFPACCNVGHLWLGTHAQNMSDMAVKGRHVAGKSHKGANNEMVKLTEQQVFHIMKLFFEDNVRPNQISMKYGVTTTCVTNILTGRSWKHLKHGYALPRIIGRIYASKSNG